MARVFTDDIEVTSDELGAPLENTELGSYNALCGDLFADMGMKGGPRSMKHTDKRGEILHNFIKQYDVCPINLEGDAEGPLNTHYGPCGVTCIDYMMVPQYLRHDVMQPHAPIQPSKHFRSCPDFDVDQFRGNTLWGSRRGLLEKA